MGRGMPGKGEPEAPDGVGKGQEFADGVEDRHVGDGDDGPGADGENTNGGVVNKVVEVGAERRHGDDETQGEPGGDGNEGAKPCTREGGPIGGGHGPEDDEDDGAVEDGDGGKREGADEVLGGR